MDQGTGETDPRVCPEDGGDHDWQHRQTAIACGRRGQSWRITSATCGKCDVHRVVTDGPDGRKVEDVVPLARRGTEGG